MVEFAASNLKSEANSTGGQLVLTALVYRGKGLQIVKKEGVSGPIHILIRLEARLEDGGERGVGMQQT